MCFRSKSDRAADSDLQAPPKIIITRTSTDRAALDGDDDNASKVSADYEKKPVGKRKYWQSMQRPSTRWKP